MRDSDWGWGPAREVAGAFGAAPRTEHSWEVLEAARGWPSSSQGRKLKEEKVGWERLRAGGL